MAEEEIVLTGFLHPICGRPEALPGLTFRYRIHILFDIQTLANYLIVF
jgi:hypothetical protein